MSSIEHVEDLLSAYLDNALTQEEQSQVATHIQTCAACSAVLADFRRLDTLLAKQPRVSPPTALRERIFSSPEYLELIETMPGQYTNNTRFIGDVEKQQTASSQVTRLDGTSRPRLVSIPGNKKSPLSDQETKARIRVPQRRNMHIQRIMQIGIAACLFLTLGVGSFVGWNLWRGQGKTAQGTSSSIAPPQSLHQGGPLPAGMRFVFLHSGSLWSGPEDGSTQAVRLTPSTVVVGPHWAVNSMLSGYSAGNLLAYVDTKQGYIHVIRSDGQSDTVVKQPLLGNVATSSWSTPAGLAILSSLSWSPDGQTLAFIGGTTGTSTLYLYSTSTNQVQTVALPSKGTISHLIWSPNGVRVAFDFTHGATTSILDYNVVTHEVLTITTLNNSNDTVLTLDWASTNATPAITWSVGTQGHVHSIWLRHVGGVNGLDAIQQLDGGDYTQAVYSRSGANGMGGWLLCGTPTTNTLSVLTLTGTVSTVANGSQIGVVQWSGKYITYFDSLASGVGTLHSIDTTNNSNTLIAHTVSATPLPLWSSDGQHILYNNGTHSFVADMHSGKIQLSVSGSITTFAWSTTSPYRVIVGTQQGVYVVDTRSNTAKSLSGANAAGPIGWTQIS